MISEIINEFKQRRYRVYSRPYELNIVGVRNPDTTPNTFNDRIYVFFKTNSGKWESFDFPATTDPGTYWLNNPMQNQGTAILKAGQYLDAYKIDRHQGLYYALCQRSAKVTVTRDFNRNAILDWNNGRESTGFFGINIHRAGRSGTTTTVNKYSAGCQVFANAEDFARFMHLCENHRNRYGNLFTYTLIDLRSLKKTQKRKWVGRTLAVLSLLGLSTYAYLKFQNKPKQKTQ